MHPNQNRTCHEKCFFHGKLAEDLNKRISQIQFQETEKGQYNWDLQIWLWDKEGWADLEQTNEHRKQWEMQKMGWTKLRRDWLWPYLWSHEQAAVAGAANKFELLRSDQIVWESEEWVSYKYIVRYLYNTYE